MSKELSRKEFNTRIQALGEQYWQRMQGEVPSLFDRQYWQGQILDWIMDDESFKIDAFHFVDVLPVLQTTSATASHVQDYLLKSDRKLPFLVRSALSMASGGIAAPIATQAIRANISEMARRFICESDSHKAVDVFKKLADQKRVVCEMGGKNAIIIDDDADMDAALKGVMHSAFGYAGQKCSACSRLILVGEIYNTFMQRLLEACKSLPMDKGTEPGCRLGPVIDQTAHMRLRALIASPPAGAITHFSGNAPSTGFFIPPTIFEVAETSNSLFQQEFFGPVLTIIRAGPGYLLNFANPRCITENTMRSGFIPDFQM